MRLNCSHLAILAEGRAATILHGNRFTPGWLMVIPRRSARPSITGVGCAAAIVATIRAAAVPGIVRATAVCIIVRTAAVIRIVIGAAAIIIRARLAAIVSRRTTRPTTIGVIPSLSRTVLPTRSTAGRIIARPTGAISLRSTRSAILCAVARPTRTPHVGAATRMRRWRVGCRRSRMARRRGVRRGCRFRGPTRLCPG